MGNAIPHRERQIVKERFRGACTRCGVSAPNGHWHHRRTRAVRDAHQHCPCVGVWLCATCHEWAHKEKFEARESGFWVSRHVSTPSEHEVKTFLGTLTLTCEGLFRFKQTVSTEET